MESDRKSEQHERILRVDPRFSHEAKEEKEGVFQWREGKSEEGRAKMCGTG